MSPRVTRFVVFFLAVASPTLAYRLGGVTLWTLLAGGLTLAAALSAWVLWQDDLLRSVMVPKQLDIALGAACSALLYLTIVFVWARVLAPDAILRRCTMLGPRVLQPDARGIGLLLEWARIHTCRGYAQSLGVLGPLRGVMIVAIATLEEIAWRGGVQQGLAEKLGSTRGWLVASVLYAAAQLAVGNPMLALLALPAGLVWGALYRYRGRLAPGIFSHVVFSYFLFAVRPVVDFT